jgi:hypothetical protein
MAEAAQEQGQGQDQGAQQFPRAFTCENFLGVNTATTRAGVDERQTYWMDGFMPLAPRNARALWGIGSPLYTASGAQLPIVCFYFYNIGATPYAVVFLSDGSAIQVNTSTAVATTILPPGTILTPSITTLGITQWGQQYLIIVAQQTNGYWVWDGGVLYSAGSIAPGVTLTNVGEGYAFPPIISASGGEGSGAQFVATVDNGIVTNVSIANAGQGYLAGDVVTLTFTGGTQAGSGGSLTAHLTFHAGGSGAVLTLNFVQDPNNRNLLNISSVTVNNPGSGYTEETVINVTGGKVFSGASAVLTANVNLGAGGTITSINVINGGRYYNPVDYPGSTFGLPTAAASDSGFYTVSSVSINSPGSGYGPAAAITVSGGGSPLVQATISLVLSGGHIVNTTINNGGVYGSNVPPTLAVTDSAITASATVSLMPFGISGNAVATFQGHVWVFNVNVFNFSAPGSVSNFATSAGGGSDQSSVSYLKVQYTQAVSTNGFLFLLGDSSMDYISGVTTATPSGGSPTTTFTQNNSDPEVGTPYPAAVTTLGQEILIANSAGVFVSSGGEFTKRSEALDGVYNTVPATSFNTNPFNGFQLSTAKATIFGKRVWMMLVPIIDPVSGSQVNKLLMFRDDGKIWWASQQDVSLTFIAGQEINSIFTAWGTDGTHIYPLFNQPSVSFTKLIQTKYWDVPGGYNYNKAVSRFWSIWDYFSASAPNITLTVDAVGVDGGGTQYTNSNTYVIPGPAAPGYFCTPAEAVGQQGILNGFTLETNAADVALVGAMVQPDEPVGYRG